MYGLTTTEPITPPDISAINVPGVFISIGLGVAIWLAASFVIRGITKRVAAGTTFFKKPHFRWVAPALRALDHERRVQRANTIGALLNSVVGVLVAVITIMYVLKNLNVDIAPLLTSVGILGIAIGFGAQQLIRDFLAGIFITLEDQYGIGDVIESSEVVGTVESMGLRITRVRAEDGTIWYLRNGEILRVGNRSQGTYVSPEAAPAETDNTQSLQQPAPQQPAPQQPAPQQKAGE
jgi:small-conductance mechanosensitive channel